MPDPSTTTLKTTTTPATSTTPSTTTKTSMAPTTTTRVSSTTYTDSPEDNDCAGFSIDIAIANATCALVQPPQEQKKNIVGRVSEGYGGFLAKEESDDLTVFTEILVILQFL